MGHLVIIYIYTDKKKKKKIYIYIYIYSQSLNNLLQQLSVKLWSYNAHMILSRLLLDNNGSNFSSWDLPVS